MKPRYQHDCNNCEILGQYDLPTAEKFYDLYVCKTPKDITIVARYGNELSEFLSRSLCDGHVHSRPLTEAMRLYILKEIGI